MCVVCVCVCVLTRACMCRQALSYKTNNWPVSPALSLYFDASWYLLFIPTILYGWCEIAYFFHILNNWEEPLRKKKRST